MNSKLAIKSILAVSLVFMLSVVSGPARALLGTPSGSTSQNIYGCTSLLGCSVHVEQVLSQLQNTDGSKNNGTYTAYVATLFNLTGRIYCVNKAGNASDANGVPFDGVEIPISAGAQINQKLVKNGRTLEKIVFDDPTLIAALNVPATCPNGNWHQIVIFTKMQVFGTQYQQDSNSASTCDLSDANNLQIAGCTVADQLNVACRIQDPYFPDPKAALGGQIYKYGDWYTGAGDCTVVCHSADSSCNLLSPITTAP
jgi:hypothetical protein